jgi:hypothetical protein
VNDDGSLGEPNDVVCTGIEEKMGIHGNATCSLALGGKGKCRGTLLGVANKGMRAMFQMMNESRLMVGNQALACVSASYLYAVNYARTRVQARHLLKGADKSAPSVPIIQHPDVRRMLMEMKVYVEGLRSLSYFIGHCLDQAGIASDPAEKAKYSGLIDFLIPNAKGYGTDRRFEMCSVGVQVYGGYGYVREFPVEQLMRDCRITAIYEGTNGIQALDLVSRKLSQEGGQPLKNLLRMMRAEAAEAGRMERVAGSAARFTAAVDRLEEVAAKVAGLVQSDLMLAAAHAYPFLEVCGDTIMAWLLLWRARIAAQALVSGGKPKDATFYEGQIRSAEFYAQNLLPVTLGRMGSILEPSNVVNDMPEDAFGGK